MLSRPLHFSGEVLRQRMDEFGTPESLRPGMIDLIATARRLGYPDLFQVTMAILGRIKHGEWTSADDLVRVEQLFRRARLDEIGCFLENSAMTLGEFEAQVGSRKLIENAQQIADAIKLREAAGVPFSDAETRKLTQLREALSDVPLAMPTL